MREIKRKRHMVFPDRTKVCTACGLERPWSLYSPRSYRADGVTVNTVHARCRECGRKDDRRPPDRDNPRLPIGPWREFLEQIRPQFEDEEKFAHALGVSPRILFRWLHENKKIPLDNADKALCRLELPHLLRDLWPHLYEFDDDALAA